MEQRANQGLPWRLAPERIGVGGDRGDQSARDPLRVSHVVRVVPDLEHRVVPGEAFASGGSPAEDSRAVGTAAEAARQLVDLLLGIEHDERSRMGERRGDDDARRLAPSRRCEDENVRVAQVAQVTPFDRSQDDAFGKLLAEPQIVTPPHLVEAGKPRGAVGIARPRKPFPCRPETPGCTGEVSHEDSRSEFDRCTDFRGQRPET
jgi:hypothetical protein